MTEEKDMKMHHGQGPSLSVGWGACWVHRRAVLATIRVDPNAIHVPNWYKICTKLPRIWYEFV